MNRHQDPGQSCIKTQLRLKPLSFHLYPDSVLHIYWPVVPGKFLMTMTYLNEGLRLCQMLPVYGSHHSNHHPPRNPYGLPNGTSKQIEPSKRKKKGENESCHHILHRHSQRINKSKSPLTVSRYTPFYLPSFLLQLTFPLRYTEKITDKTPKMESTTRMYVYLYYQPTSICPVLGARLTR